MEVSVLSQGWVTSYAVWGSDNIIFCWPIIVHSQVAMAQVVEAAVAMAHGDIDTARFVLVRLNTHA